MINDPIISILLPVKNCEKYITNSINSILNQSFWNYELLILDSSIDKTSEIIKEFKDSRIKYHSLKNYSLSEALNYGIDFARGEYLARMDADDISYESRLQSQYNFIISNKQIDVLGTNYCLISKQNNILYKKKMPEFHREIELNMPLHASVLHPTILLKKCVLDKIKYNDIDAEDYDLFLVLLKSGCKFHNLQKYLYGYRLKIIDYRVEIRHNEIKLLKGKDYIEHAFKKEKNLKTYYFQLGILEYYCNNLKKSRKYLIKYLKLNPSKILLIIRFLILSYLGDNIITSLRRKKYLNFINKSINRVFKYEPRKYFNYNKVNG